MSEAFPLGDCASPDRAEAERFIAALTGSTDTPVTFQTFDDDKTPGHKKDESLARIFHGPLAQQWPALVRLNEQGAGVYLMVNEGNGAGRSSAAVRSLRALFADDDSGTLTPRAIELTPTTIVQSKAGLQPYWRLRPGEALTEFSRAQKRLAAAYGTDPVVHDLPRVMRLPGFLHLKDPAAPFLVRVLQTAEVSYSIAEVLDGAPPVAEADPASAPWTGAAAPARSEWPTIEQRTARARAWLAKRDPAIGDKGLGGSSKTLVTAEWLALGYALGEERAFDLLWNEYNPKCDPPWSEKELRRKVSEAATKGTAVRPGQAYEDDKPRLLSNASRPLADQQARTDWPPLLRFDEAHVPPFPIEALTPWHRVFVEELAAFSQVHPDMPAMLSLASLSTACAGRFHVEVRDGYTETLNLFVAVVMDSGDRKSGVFKACCAPLRTIEAELLARARPAIVAAKQREQILEARLDYLRKKIAKEDDDTARGQLELDAVNAAKGLDGLPRIIEPRLLADDITPQALGILLQSCGEQIGVFAPEGGIFKTLGGRYSDGVADLDLVLKSHGGEPVTVDRVSRGTVQLEHPLVTFGLTIQPRVLKDLAATPGAIELGFAGRFLYSLPGSEVGKRAAMAPPMSGEGAIEYANKVRTLLAARVPGQTTDPIRMSPEALAVRDAFHDEIEPRLTPGAGDLAVPGVKEWARKLLGAMARLAGILHCCKNAEPTSVPISGQTATEAVLLSKYLLEHARAAFLTMGTDIEIERAKLVLDWIRRKGCSQFSQRDLYQAKRKTFEDKATLLRQTLELLEAHGYVRALGDERTGPGRRSERYEVRDGL